MSGVVQSISVIHFYTQIVPNLAGWGFYIRLMGKIIEAPFLQSLQVFEEIKESPSNCITLKGMDSIVESSRVKKEVSSVPGEQPCSSGPANHSINNTILAEAGLELGSFCPGILPTLSRAIWQSPGRFGSVISAVVPKCS